RRSYLSHATMLPDVPSKASFVSKILAKATIPPEAHHHAARRRRNIFSLIIYQIHLPAPTPRLMELDLDTSNTHSTSCPKVSSNPYLWPQSTFVLINGTRSRFAARFRKVRPDGQRKCHRGLYS